MIDKGFLDTKKPDTVWSMKYVWLVTDSIINKKKTIENTLKNYLKEKT